MLTRPGITHLLFDKVIVPDWFVPPPADPDDIEPSVVVVGP